MDREIEDSIKIGTPEEKFWADLKERTIKANEQCEREIIINNSIVTLCDLRIAEEKEKFK
jgi:hypothetical protein